MSGVAEVGLALGLVSAIITIVEAAQEIYEAADNAKGLPKRLRAAVDQIPLVCDALRLAEKNLNASGVSIESCQSAKPVLERCKSTAESIKDLLDKTITTNETSKWDRRKKAMNLSSKSKKIKKHMEELVEDMALLYQHQLFQDAEVLEDIKMAIEQLNSISEEDESARYIHSGSGDINAGTVQGNQNIQKSYGNGSMYSAHQQYFSKDQVNNYYHSRDSYQGPTENDKCCQVFETSNLDYEEIKKRSPLRAADTCQWALTHPHYLRWRQSEYQDLLWISADPGCGKSVLARSLVDQDLQDNEDRPIVCYFFFKDDEDKNDLATALRALLHQLFTQRPDLLRYALPAFRRIGEGLAHKTHEMWRILRLAASDPGAPSVICVLDALDECRTADQRRLVDLLQDLCQPSPENLTSSRLKVLATSRPLNRLRDDFDSFLPQKSLIRLGGEHQNKQIREEINLVIRTQVRQLANKFKLSLQNHDRLRDQLLNMQHRTYLWLHLAMDEIRKTYARNLYPDDVVIDTLPVSVQDAYERILAKTEIDQTSRAREVLLIITGARRPLKVEEMALALASADAHRDGAQTLRIPNADQLKEQIGLWCGVFVCIQESSLFLIHQTAKDFLLSNKPRLNDDGGLWCGSLSPLIVELELAQLCTKYLCAIQQDSLHRQKREGVIKTSADIETSGSRREFFEYCAEHWTSHTQGYTLRDKPGLFKRILTLYDTSSELYQSWSSIWWKSLNGYRDDPRFLIQHLGAFNGHTEVLEFLSRDQHIDLEKENGEGSTALHLAAAEGHSDTVRWLLENGANIYTNSQRGNAITTAITAGHVPVVQLLLDTLLSRGADIDMISCSDGNALCQASMTSHLQVVKLLLDRGADVNGGRFCSQEVKGACTFPKYPLMAASARGHLPVVQLLLNRGADVNAGLSWHSALHAASVGTWPTESPSLASMSMHFGCDEERYSYDIEPRIKRRGHSQVVKLLLEYGAHLNTTGKSFANLLYTASEQGWPEVVQLLLGKNVDVNSKGGVCGSPLQAASYGGYLRIVQLLLCAGAEVNAAEGEYGSALYLAFCRDHLPVMQLLAGKGANVRTPKSGLQGITNLFLQVSLQVGQQSLERSDDIIDVICDATNIAKSFGDYSYIPQKQSMVDTERFVLQLLERCAYAIGDESALREALIKARQDLSLRWAILHNNLDAISRAVPKISKQDILNKWSSLGLANFEKLSENLIRFRAKDAGWCYFNLLKCQIF